MAPSFDAQYVNVNGRQATSCSQPYLSLLPVGWAVEEPKGEATCSEIYVVQVV